MSYKRVMKKVDKFYKNPKKEELYDFNISMLEYLIPRLNKFVVDSSSMIDWDAHKAEGVDVINTINSIIDDFEYVLEHHWVYDNKEAKEYNKRLKRAFKNLGDIFVYLWW